MTERSPERTSHVDLLVFRVDVPGEDGPPTIPTNLYYYTYSKQIYIYIFNITIYIYQQSQRGAIHGGQGCPEHPLT